MTQSKKDSFIESVVNILVRAPINMMINFLVFPLFGYEITLSQNFGFMVVFTAISLITSYGIRRVFNQKSIYITIKNSILKKSKL